MINPLDIYMYLCNAILFELLFVLCFPTKQGTIFVTFSSVCMELCLVAL